MGILNVTPDSFSDGGAYLTDQSAIDYAMQMIEHGADIIDIGGESTRPGAESVRIEEEIRRTVPVIKEIKKLNPQIKISIDTTKYETAKAALDAGANIINDISGLQFEPRLAELAADYNAALVIMHINGTPQNMQANPRYVDLIREVHGFLSEKISYAQEFGVKKIITDVGIGFGKTYQHNIELLRNLELFKFPGTLQMLGISRKSFIGKMLGEAEPKERDTATAMIHAILINNPVDIIRVHNVKLLTELRTIFNEIYN